MAMPETRPPGLPSLGKQHQRAQRRLRLRAFLLVLPLLSFIVIAFVVPIALILLNSVHSDVISKNLPQTIQALKSWEDTSAAPAEAAYAALVQDLINSRKDKKNRTDGKIATRVNREKAGMLSMIKKTARRAQRLKPPYKEALIKVDKRWGEPAVWQILEREGSPLTASFYIAALDLRYNDEGEIVSRDEEVSIYITLFTRTLWISALITFLCILLGFPVAYLLATIPTKIANLLMILVLLPFWTSLLVRTTSWIVLLQTYGPLNDLLVFVGLIDEEGRVRMIYNMIGTVIAMTHILLPFTILPIYSVMKNIPPSYMRAAISLGSSWFYAFRRVYLPLTLPGIGAGGLLVFILAVGYYITPALVGGSSGQLISNLIAHHMSTSLNWGLAAALSGLLLALVMSCYWLYNRLVGIDKIRF